MEGLTCHHTVNGRDFETWTIDGEWFWHRTHRRLIGDEIIDVVVPEAYGPFESRQAALEHATDLLGRGIELEGVE